MKIAIIVGTRPEIIKLSPILRELIKRKMEFILIHTNQHYSQDMDRVFFDELQLPHPQYNLNIHDLSQGAMVGKMLTAVESILMTENPDWVIVQGDTNTVLASALAAAKLGIKVCHVEAGLRSYDRTMPEEINRVLTDHISELLCCPTARQKDIVKGEGIDEAKIHVTGNTIVDAVQQNLNLISPTEGAPVERYFLLTMHRPSNVDKKENLENLMKAFEKLSRIHKAKIIFPTHPRTRAALKKFGMTPDPETILLYDPVGYLAMLNLIKNAQLVITDSGGVQEEACIIHVPCITIRNNTERPETVHVGANRIVGIHEEEVLEGANAMLGISRDWAHPFGDGTAAIKIIELIEGSI